MLIKNIKWDTDGDMEALASLPTEVYTPSFLREEQYDDIEEFLDDVSDWLSDEYAGAILDSRRKPTMKESSNAILCLNEAERRKYQNVH